MFLTQCKINYLDGITPSDTNSFTTESYKKLVNLGRDYIEQNQLKKFFYFLGEGQYFVALWAAHIIIEYGNPNEEMYKDCLDTIIEYSNNPLSPKVSEEEREWLQSHLKNKSID